MRLFILSDLHIQGPEDALYSKLIQWLKATPRPGDFIVLGGDIFDFFVGNKKNFQGLYLEFFRVLEQTAKKNIRIEYIDGNHDFHMEKIFKNIEGLHAHSNSIQLELNEKRFFIAHGDLVNRRDYSYRVLRRFLRSSFLYGFASLLPGRMVQLIGTYWSRMGRYRREHPYENKSMEMIELLRKPYRNFAAEKISSGFDYVVLGHTHDPDEMRFQVGSRTGQYINMGFPRQSQKILVWNVGSPLLERQEW